MARHWFCTACTEFALLIPPSDLKLAWVRLLPSVTMHIQRVFTGHGVYRDGDPGAWAPREGDRVTSTQMRIIPS